MKDTPEETDRWLHEAMMRKSGEERFLMGCAMYEAARDLVLASLPDSLTEEERKRAFFERMYGMPLERFVPKGAGQPETTSARGTAHPDGRHRRRSDCVPQ